jgi:hypothetical protein
VVAVVVQALLADRLTETQVAQVVVVYLQVC